MQEPQLRSILKGDNIVCQYIELEQCSAPTQDTRKGWARGLITSPLTYRSSQGFVCYGLTRRDYAPPPFLIYSIV